MNTEPEIIHGDDPSLRQSEIRDRGKQSPWLALNLSQWVGLLLPVCTAGFLVAAMLAAPNMLTGIRGVTGDGYDDGVHVGTALRLTQFAFPYRDYIFLHPPGITVLLAPLGVFGRLVSEQDALVVARLITAAAVVANVGLVGFLLRKRGAWAMAVGGFVLALWPLTSYISTTVMIEPYLGFFLLAACVAMFREDEVVGGRRLFLAGVFLGIALSLKLIAVIPVAALVAVCIWRRRRECFNLIKGIAISLAVIVLPFFIMAPLKFFEDVVITQMQRKPTITGGPSLNERLATILGLESSPSSGAEENLAIVLSATVVFVILLMCVVKWGRQNAFEIAVIASWVCSVAFLLRTPDVFSQYPYLSTVFLALLLGICAGELWRFVRWFCGRQVPDGWRLVAGTVAVAAVAALVFFVGIQRSVEMSHKLRVSAIEPSEWIVSAIPAGSCVVFDVPTLAVVGDRLLANDECPDLIDPFGLWLASEDHANRGGALKPAELVETWQTYFDQADYVMMSVDYSSYIPWTPELRARFASDFNKVASQAGIVIYKKV